MRRFKWRDLARRLAAVVVLAVSSVAGAQSPEAVAEADAANRRGAQYFTEGYYVSLPRKRFEEAALKLAQAEMEFKAALSLNDRHVTAHRNLARLCYIQKRYAEAAEHYKKTAELRPGDTDAFIQAALAYAEIRQFDQAEAMLAAARAKTRDRLVIKRLDIHSEKLKQLASAPLSSTTAPATTMPAANDVRMVQ